MQGTAKDFIRREGWPFVISCGLVYVVFLMQLLGISLANDSINLHLVTRPVPAAWRFVGEIAFDLSTLAPFLALSAVYIIRTAVAYETMPARRRFVWAVALISLILSFAEFWWSWSGHPTWLRGFLG
jgi:hypothetical protein